MCSETTGVYGTLTNAPTPGVAGLEFLLLKLGNIYYIRDVIFTYLVPVVNLFWREEI